MTRTRFAITATAAMLTASFSGLAVAQDMPNPQPAAAEEGPAPQITFIKTRHDFGTILDTNKEQIVFRFRNDGEGVLKITNIKSTCGCAVPDLEKTEYQPGETGEILVFYDPRGRSGPQNRVIMVSTNDPSEPVVRLGIQAEIKELVQIEPKTITFGQVKPGQEQTVMVDVYTRDPLIEIGPATVTHGEGIFAQIMGTEQVELEGETVTSTSIMVTLADAAPLGRVLGRISLRVTDAEGKPSVKTIPVTGQIIGDIRIIPNRVNLGILDPGQSYDRNIRLMSTSNKPFNILKVEEVPDKGPGDTPRPKQLGDFIWESAPLAAKRTDAYSLRIIGDAPVGTNRLYTRLIITTDREDEKRIPVYVTARVRDKPLADMMEERNAVPTSSGIEPAKPAEGAGK